MTHDNAQAKRNDDRSTPRPWQRNINTNYPIYYQNPKNYKEIVHIANVISDNESDLDLIVKAVNAYDDLVEACKAALNDPPPTCLRPDVVKKLSQALTKAEGRG